jgi:hypothetical protein
MKILLLGEYSNVHATLAKGLRKLGHKVTVASNGDLWKGYERDIDLARKDGKWGGLCLYIKMISLLPWLRGYDVVQLINPMFLELKAERIKPIYNFLRKHNKCVVMGAFGMDYYWVSENLHRLPMKYSDFNIGKHLRTDEPALRERNDWLNTPKGKLNKIIANSCDGIVAGLYEYWVCYHPVFPDKTVFIPYPVVTDPDITIKDSDKNNVVKLFLGISRGRSAYKGTDIMWEAARDICKKYPDKISLRVVEGLPYHEYVKAMKDADIILDQLYSYTPAMNSLQAMSMGIISMGGGEEEGYEIINEKELRPIINVEPSYRSVYTALEHIAQHPEEVTMRRQQSVDYVRKHHNYVHIAKQYEAFYNRLVISK